VTARAACVIVLLALAPARPAAARSPVDAAILKVRRAGRTIGNLIGAPIGGLVEAATTPTLRTAERSAQRLIHDTDAAVAERIDQAFDRADDAAAARIAQVDRSLDARILQVKTGVDDSLIKVLAGVDQSLARLDAVARRRIAQIDAVAMRLVQRIDDATSKLLAEADAITARRVGEVRALVQSSIAQADAAAAARIAQLDETAGRRIGNLDVIATKQTLSLEASLLRIVRLAGFFIFMAFVLWRIVVEIGDALRKTRRFGRRWIQPPLAETIPGNLLRLGAQVVGAAACAGALWWLGDRMPRDANADAARQLARHEAGLTDGVRSYDFTAVRFHASQLEILAPDRPELRAVAQKAELIRSVFERPGQLQSLDGLRQLVVQLHAAEQLLDPPDPDLLVLEGYLLWQVGSTRADELEAAALCARALDRKGAPLPGGFLLEPLAAHYVEMFVRDPYDAPDAAADQLAAVHAAAARLGGHRAELAPLQHLFEYDRLIAALDAATSTAYLDMIEAHADVVLAARGWKPGTAEPDALRRARERRVAAAAVIVEAWGRFDGELETSPWLAGDPTALSAFTLDDAPRSHALYFIVRPDATTLPPSFFAPPPADPKARVRDTALRVEMAPLRVTWAHRYAPMFAESTQSLLAYEESQRFRRLEERALGFEQAYVDFLIAARTGAPTLSDKAIAAARGAAELGLYRDGPTGRVTAASLILAQLPGVVPRDALEQIAERYRERRLRLL